MAGRKKLDTAVQVEPVLDQAKLAERSQELVVAHQAGGVVTGEKNRQLFDVAMRVGRIQSALVAATVADKIIAEQYTSIVESKAYVGAPYTDDSGNPATVATIEEFCQAYFGKSARRCREISSNLQLLGSSLYDAAEKIGLGQRDYNALRALPADDQEVIKQAMAEGADHESVVGLLVSSHERLAKQIEEVRADLEAKDQRITKLSDDLNKAEEKTAKAQKKWKRATPDEQSQELLTQLEQAAAQVRIAIASGSEEAGFSGAAITLMQHAEQHGLNVEEQVAGVIASLINDLRLVRDHQEVGVTVIHDRRLADWKREG